MNSGVASEMIVETIVFAVVMIGLLIGFGVSFYYEHRNRVFHYYRTMLATAAEHAHAHDAAIAAHHHHPHGHGHAHRPSLQPELPRHVSTPVITVASVTASASTSPSHHSDVAHIPPPSYSALPPSQRDFPWYCRRTGMCAGLCCLIWSFDLHGSLDLYPFVIGNLVATLATGMYFGVLSWWIYFHSLAVFKQINNSAPPAWFRRYLMFFPMSFTIAAWCVNIGLEVTAHRVWQYSYNLHVWIDPGQTYFSTAYQLMTHFPSVFAFAAVSAPDFRAQIAYTRNVFAVTEYSPEVASN